jgi:hypothetical protein
MSVHVPRPTTPLHRWIWRGLVAGGCLAFAIIVSAALWGVLSLAGDRAGAAGARGVTLVAALAAALDLAALVALLAWDRIADKNSQ